MATLNTVQKDLQTLSKKDLRAVITAAKFLLGDSSDEGEVSSVKNLELFYQTVNDALYKRNRSKLPPLAVFKHQNQYSKLVSGLDRLDKFLDVAVNTKVKKRTDYLRFYDLFVHHALEDLERMGIPITLKNLLMATDRVEDIIDRCYPSYVANNLFATVLNLKPVADT